MTGPVRWGFLGAGFVATRAMAPAIHAAAGAVLQVAAARDLARAQALGPLRATTSYAEVCAADDVDAVYLSLPNDAHLPWVERALAGGKHVLCEKPLGLSGDEVARMARASERSGRLLVEAAWNRWHPRTRRVEQLLVDLPRPRQVRAWFTFPGVPEGNYRLVPARGGGALLDVGCYAAGLVLPALGGPGGVTVTAAQQHLGASGVDLTTLARLRGPQGEAELRASFEQEQSQGFVVAAGEVSLELGWPAFTSWREPSWLRRVADGVEHVESFAPVDAYQLMLESVSARIAGAEAWVLPLESSLSVATLLDRIAQAAGAAASADQPS